MGAMDVGAPASWQWKYAGVLADHSVAVELGGNRLESAEIPENPAGSMKDRMARAVISRAEADGLLKPGDTVVEFTGGSTRAALALVCTAKGYRI